MRRNAFHKRPTPARTSRGAWSCPSRHRGTQRPTGGHAGHSCSSSWRMYLRTVFSLIPPPRQWCGCRTSTDVFFGFHTVSENCRPPVRQHSGRGEIIHWAARKILAPTVLAVSLAPIPCAPSPTGWTVLWVSRIVRSRTPNRSASYFVVPNLVPHQ